MTIFISFQLENTNNINNINHERNRLQMRF